MQSVKVRFIFLSIFLFVATVNLQGALLGKKNNLNDVIDVISSISVSKGETQIKAVPQVRAIKINESKLADVIDVIATLKNSLLDIHGQINRIKLLIEAEKDVQSIRNAQKKVKEIQGAQAEAKKRWDVQTLNDTKQQTIQAFFLNEIKSSYLSKLTADQQTDINKLEEEAKRCLLSWLKSKSDFIEYYKLKNQIESIYEGVIISKYYNNHIVEYSELQKFIKKYSCSQGVVNKENFIIKKNDQISRIINAERAKKCIQENKLNLLGIPDKCLMLTPDGFIVYAKKIEYVDLPLFSLEQQQQFKLFQDLTGFSDVRGNILYDPKVNKIMIIDLEDNSFLNPKVQPGLPKNTKYDDPSIDFEKVKKEFKSLNIGTQKEIEKVFNASDKYWKSIENEFRSQLNLGQH